MRNMDRRKLLLTGAGLAALTLLAGCEREDEQISQPGLQSRALAGMISALFPHTGLKRSVYDDIAARARDSLQTRANWPALQQQGAAALGPDGWSQLDAKARAAKLEALSETEFFQTVYQTALFEFYSHPAVWALVGYPGESESYGGYLHRGFDDIDWLPEDPQ